MTLPTVVPTSGDALAMHHLSQTLVDSPAWRSWVGAVGQPDPAAAAGERIWIRELPQAEVARPFALVYDGRIRHPILAAGDTNVFDLDGSIGLLIEAETPADYRAPAKSGDAAYWFSNSLGAVAADLMALAGGAGYLNIVLLAREQIGRSSQAENATEGDYFQGVYRVEYR